MDRVTPEPPDKKQRLDPFAEGRRQASKICGRETRWLKSSWINAFDRRDRLAARFFVRRSQRQYLNGFIECLEEEICRRAALGDADALMPPTVASLMASQGTGTPAPAWKKSWSRAIRKRLSWLRLRKPGREGPRSDRG
jgi:hypothetical protein